MKIGFVANLVKKEIEEVWPPIDRPPNVLEDFQGVKLYLNYFARDGELNITFLVWYI